MPTPLEALIHHASMAWPEWFTGEPAPLLEPAVLLASHRHAVVLLFAGGAKTPAIVMKVGSADEETFLLSQEYERLSEIRPAVPSDIREGIPRPLGLERVDGMVVMALGSVEGDRLPVPNLLGRGRTRDRHALGTFLRDVFAWSRELTEATGRPREAGEAELSEVASSFVALCEADGIEISAGRAFARALAAEPIGWHPACEQGDPSVKNGLVHQGRLRFVDWGDSRSEGTPWSDIAYAPGAIAQLAQWQSGRPLRDAALRTLDSSTWAGAIVHREMKRVWNYPLPLSWAVTLNAMARTLRSRRYFKEMPVTDLPMGRFALLLLTDVQFRDALDWLAPRW